MIPSHTNTLKAVSLFINTADDSDEVPDVSKEQPTYGSYKISSEEWHLLSLIQKVLKVRNSFYHVSHY